MLPHKFVFMACVASQVRFHGVCRLTSSFSWRVSPHKFVFMATVVSQVRFHGVCRLTSSFSWFVSPHKFFLMACVVSQVRFHGVCRLTSSFSWCVSPHKFVFMAWSPHKFVFMALSCLQQELAKPTPVFDLYKALAGLESLVDLARDNADARTKSLSTFLRQCRPLLGKPQFQTIWLKLLGDKEDVEVAKAIQNSLRPSLIWGPSFASRPPRPGSSRRSIDFSYAPRPPPTFFN